MKLRHRHAVISFCPDLTSADAESVPVAVLLVGEDEDQRYPLTAIAYPSDIPTTITDPVAAEIIASFPRQLQAYLDEAVTESASLDIDATLETLFQSLRNSLHVSAISKLETVDVTEADIDEGLESALYGATTRMVITAFKRVFAGTQKVYPRLKEEDLRERPRAAAPAVLHESVATYERTSIPAEPSPRTNVWRRQRHENHAQPS